jgi:hypothetical protein
MGMSLRKAINAMCRECIYDPLAGGTAAKQIECFTITTCPLYPVRPTRRKSSSKPDSKLRDESGRILKKRPLEIEL